ncbi:MAG: UbiD family decarboxylase [Thermodesulfobacteriota bacterium]
MSFRTFLQQHRDLSEIEDIHAEVDPELELSARVYTRIQRSASPPLMWFHSLKDCSCAVVSNLFGSKVRLVRILSCAGTSLHRRLAQVPASVRSWQQFCEYLQYDYSPGESLYSENPPSLTEVPDLRVLPWIRYWKGDSGAYFSLPVVFTRIHSSAEINAGVYRLSPIDARSLTLNWRPGCGAYTRWRQYAERGERMPVSVILGVDPRLIFAALFPLPSQGAELALWSFISGSQQNFGLNSEGLPVPYSSEIVLEGYVDPDRLHPEGSFANHTGFYTTSVPCPVMYVERIRARHDAIMPITVVGPPHTENGLLGAYVWELLFVFLQREFPFLCKLISPPETANLPLVVLQVEAPASPAEWGDMKKMLVSHPVLARVHTLILVDERTDTSDFMLIFWHCMNQDSRDYSVLHGGIRVVDGVRWRYSTRRKVMDE